MILHPMLQMFLDKLMEKLECAAKSAMEWFYYNGMKLNSRKCHRLVCGHKFECVICNIENSQVIETHVAKLLVVKIESELTFNTHREILCRKASQKLNALSRLCSIIPFEKRKMLMQTFFYISIFLQSFGMDDLCSRRLNTKIRILVGIGIGGGEGRGEGGLFIYVYFEYVCI